MLSFIKSIGLLEICLFQVIFYSIIWFWNDYYAILMTSIITTILFFVLIVSLISEVLERSKVPAIYFKVLGVSVAIPLIVAAFFATVLGVTPF